MVPFLTIPGRTALDAKFLPCAPVSKGRPPGRAANDVLPGPAWGRVGGSRLGATEGPRRREVGVDVAPERP